jgi:hypothetical protein
LITFNNSPCTVVGMTKPLIHIVYYARGIRALAEVSLNSYRGACVRNAMPGFTREREVEEEGKVSETRAKCDKLPQLKHDIARISPPFWTLRSVHMFARFITLCISYYYYRSTVAEGLIPTSS